MSTKTKDYKVTITDQQDEYIFSAKNKNAIYIKGITQEDIDTDSFRIDGSNLLFTASGKDFIVSKYTGIKYIKTDKDNKKTELLDIIANSYVDNTNNEITSYNTKKLTVTGTNYNDKIDLSESGYIPTGKTNIKKNKGLTISGGNGNDEITGTDYNDIIKGGNGNDIIEGGVGADTITGGAGVNTIIITDDFGSDTVNLTKKEELIIDLINCPDITELSDLRCRLSGNNLIITIPEDEETNKGVLTLKNYTKNILKSLSFNLYDQETITFNNLSELTNCVVFDYDTSHLNKKKVLTGSAYNDRIEVENITTKKYTINAGNGENEITVVGGKNVINAGKNKDTINISEYGNYTINAGKGTNSINIDNSDKYGTIVINEQKVSAINNIAFSEELLNPSFERVGNDLKIKDDNGQILVKSYYATVKNKSTFNISIGGEESSLSSYLSEQTTDINGSGKIYGTDNDDNITINGKKAVSVYAGKGDDEIGYAKGNRTIYLYEGDGNDVVEAGGGTDTLKFQNGTVVTTELEYNTDGTENLVINYGTKGDSITFLNYNKKSKLYYYIGKKKYSLSTSKNQGETIEIDEFITHYEGTNKNDTILDTLVHTLDNSITINALDGDDYIDAHHDIIYAGNGNDYVHSTDSIVYGEDGNDTIINSKSTNEYYNFSVAILGGDGDDTILNEQNSNAESLNGGNGNDHITNDTNGRLYCINGEDGDDTIINDGTVSGYIWSGEGDDDILNDTNGTVYEISGDEGNDNIINNGTISHNLSGGTGNDTITTGKNSSAEYIPFNIGDGHDTLYLYSAKDILYFNNITNITYCWSDNSNDLILSYNDNSDSITIKNFNLDNNSVFVNYNKHGNYLLSEIIKSGNTITDFENVKFTDLLFTYENVEFGWYKHKNVLTISDGNISKVYDLDCLFDKKIIALNDNDELTEYYLSKDVLIHNTDPSTSTPYKDIIINDINGTVEHIFGGDGEDTITNNGTVSHQINGGDGDDTITNDADGTVNYRILGGKGSDTIVNYGTVRVIYGYIDGWVEEDANTIINNGIVSSDGHGSSGSICGSGGNDLIANNGTVSYQIHGGGGDDSITNNGTVTGFIYGGKGNDIITTGENSSAYYISFTYGDGNDTLYLNAPVNTLDFPTYNSKYDWLGDDLVIKYSNDNYSDSITIKNYDPLNNNIIVNVGRYNYIDLATLVPEKPTTLSMPLGAANTGINELGVNELNYQIATFASTSSSDMSLDYNDLSNTNDISVVMSEYVNNPQNI